MPCLGLAAGWWYTHICTWAIQTGLCLLRRICPGMHLANSSVWIAIASILATLQISRAVGDDGNEVVPEIGFTYGLSRWSGFFPCRFHCLTMSPQSSKALSVCHSAQVWTAQVWTGWIASFTILSTGFSVLLDTSFLDFACISASDAESYVPVFAYTSWV
jgi:hypothetical protein